MVTRTATKMRRIAFIIPVLVLAGCASAKAFKLPDLNLFKHEQKGDVQAVKTGDVALTKGKTDVQASASVAPVTGVGSAGGDIIKMITNSDAVVTAIISAMSAAIGALASIAGSLLIYVRILSNQRAKVEARLLDFMNKQEDGQNKYIAMLERMAEKREATS
jgi:hypothetical protein